VLIIAAVILVVTVLYLRRILSARAGEHLSEPCLGLRKIAFLANSSQRGAEDDHAAHRVGMARRLQLGAPRRRI
jgi:hypothetical protein